MGDCGHVQNVLWDVQQKDQRWERGGRSTRKRRGGEQEADGRLLVGLSPGQARSAQSALSFCQTLFNSLCRFCLCSGSVCRIYPQDSSRTGQQVGIPNADRPSSRARNWMKGSGSDQRALKSLMFGPEPEETCKHEHLWELSARCARSTSKP